MLCTGAASRKKPGNYSLSRPFSSHEGFDFPDLFKGRRKKDAIL